MPKTFAITPVKSRVTLDENGQGRVTFNVSNTSNQGLRGRVTPVPLQSTERAWLTVEGETERNFSADQTHQFSVAISVPKGTEPGEFSMRIDCAATTNPDELFSEGPVVAFEVPQPVAPKPFPWLLVVAAVLALLVIGGAVWWFVIRDTSATVPNVIGQSVTEAQAALQAAGLVSAERLIDRFTESADQLPEGVNFPPPAGSVVGTRPAVGDQVAAGSTVALEVEVEATTVPQLVNLTTESAISKLQQAKLNLGEFEFKSSLPQSKSKVVDQKPAANQRIRAGGSVDIWVGTGTIQIHVWTAKAAVNQAVLTQADVQALSRLKANKSVIRLLEPEKPEGQ